MPCKQMWSEKIDDAGENNKLFNIPALTFQDGSLVFLAERRSCRYQYLRDGGNGGFCGSRRWGNALGTREEDVHD